MLFWVHDFTLSCFYRFFLYSFCLGTLFPRIGDIQIAMGLTEGHARRLYWPANWLANFTVAGRQGVAPIFCQAGDDIWHGIDSHVYVTGRFCQRPG